MSKGRTRKIQARARKFAELIAQATSQINAWREVTPNWVNLADQEQHNQAYRFAHHPIVEAEVKARLQSTVLASYMSASQYADRVKQRADSLLTDAPTAAAAYDRLFGQALGHLRDNLTVDSKNIPIDKLLADLIAAGLPESVARRKLGMPVGELVGSNVAALPASKKA